MVYKKKSGVCSRNLVVRFFENIHLNINFLVQKT